DVFTPYLGHFIKGRQAYLRSRCKGATVPHIDGRILQDLEVPLPPITEQRRIAEILDKVDDLRAKRRTALAQLDFLTESIFLELHESTKNVSRPMRLSDVAAPTRGSFVNGPFGSNLLTSELRKEGVPVIYI